MKKPKDRNEAWRFLEDCRKAIQVASDNLEEAKSAYNKALKAYVEFQEILSKEEQC